MYSPFSSDHQPFQALHRLWIEWNPLGHPESQPKDYESLAILTLETLRNRPSLEELVFSLKYFIKLEAGPRRTPPEPYLMAFATRVLEDKNLTVGLHPHRITR